MRRFLVVADETLGGTPLLDEISARHEGGESHFVVLVPASVPAEGLTWTESEARGLAQDRVDRVLNRLRRLGVKGDGKVADADPLLAIQDALRDDKFDEVILSAPSKRSGWMKPDLPRKVKDASRLPVTFVPGEREEALRETALMRTHLLAGLPRRHLRTLAKLARVHSYRPGTPILEDGAFDSDLYVILDGRVKVVEAGRTVDHLTVGDIFSETALLAPGARTAAVIAEAPTRCLRLPGRGLHDAVAHDSKLAQELIQASGERLRELGQNLRNAMSSLLLDGELLEQLAEAAHISYCAEELAKGSAWGEPTDEYLLRHEALAPYAGRSSTAGGAGPNLVAYEKLPESVKEQNRDLVRDIPKKLAAAGYLMRPFEPGETQTTFSEEEIELLAEREHDRWVRLKLAQDWSFAASRDDEARQHPDLVPWDDLTPDQRESRYGMEDATRIGPGTLPDGEKIKDRALIRTIGSILSRAGYTAVRIGLPAD